LEHSEKIEQNSWHGFLIRKNRISFKRLCEFFL